MCPQCAPLASLAQSGARLGDGPIQFLHRALPRLGRQVRVPHGQEAQRPCCGVRPWARGERRAGAGCHRRSAPSMQPTRGTPLPGLASLAAGGGCPLATQRLCAQHHALWGGPWAGAGRGGCQGRPRCSHIERPPCQPVSQATARRLPPQRAQAKMSNAKLRRSSQAQSRQGVRLFFGSSTPGANDGFPSGGPSSSPAGGIRSP